MGFRISWIASRQPKHAVLSALGLIDTEEPDEVNEAEFSVAELPTGWTVLWSNDPTFATIAVCQPLAQRSPVVSCWVNETAMVSSVNYFDAGLYWSVGHDASREATIEGNVPAEFQDIVDRLLGEQAKSDAEHPGMVDYLFDVPIEIAQRMTGFRHDLMDFEWGTAKFTVAEQSANLSGEAVHKPSLFKRWFSWGSVVGGSCHAIHRDRREWRNHHTGCPGGRTGLARRR